MRVLPTDHVAVEPVIVEKEAGFTVLEALIAVAILAAALIPLLGMQSQFIARVEAQERLQTRLSAQSAIIAELDDVNFQIHKTGELRGRAYQARWQAAPRGEAQTTRVSSGERARFDVISYIVTVRVDYDDAPEAVYILPGLGWQAKWAISGG